MPRARLIRVHLAASVAATTAIAAFLITSVTVDLAGGEGAIRTAKQGILYGLGVLVPALATAGLTGQRLAGRSPAPTIARKRGRMKAIGAIGVYVLVPCAILLSRMADRGDIGTTFAAVQTGEMLAGTINLSLLILNMRDGMGLRAHRRSRASVARSAPATQRP